MAQYWTSEQNQAIQDYQNTNDQNFKNKIYTDHLHSEIQQIIQYHCLKYNRYNNPGSKAQLSLICLMAISKLNTDFAY